MKFIWANLIPGNHPTEHSRGTETTDWTWGNPVGYTHCDIHEMVFYGGTMYVGSDGLITKTTDGGSTWTNLTEGIGIRQFYRIGTSKNDPYKILGGSQDNGTSVYSYDHWHEWLGADGMECLPDYSNSNIVYGTTQNGNFNKSNAGGNFGNVNIAQPGEGNWVTPFVIHPTDPANTICWQFGGKKNGRWHEQLVHHFQLWNR